MKLEQPPITVDPKEWVWKSWFQRLWKIVSTSPSLSLTQSNTTNQGAAITATTLLLVPVDSEGRYRVSFQSAVTRAATTSSVLGGTNGFQVIYTDPNDSVVKTHKASIADNRNTTAAAISDVQVIYAKAGTNIQYSYDYTSVGATSMQYDLNIIVEFLG